MKKILALLGCLGMAAGVTAACGEAEELVDCHRVCDRYQTCFDEDFDVGACRASCEDQSDQDMDFARKVDECEACIDDRSCSAATFACANECVGIVP